MTPEQDPANTLLAAILRLDTLPRQLGRIPPASDQAEVLDLATRLIASGSDKNLSPWLRSLVFLPFMHSDQLLDRERAVALFAGLRRETQDPLFESAYEVALHQRDALLDRFMQSPRGD